MKKKSVFLLVFLLLSLFHASAYNQFRLIITEGSNDQALMNKVEKSVSALMTEINRCQELNKDYLDLPVLYTTPEARQSLNKLWQNDHFRCKEIEVAERLLTTRDGYQIRNIPLVVYPNTGEEQDYQEAVINLDADGIVQSFYYTINKDLYTKQSMIEMSDSNKEVNDIKERMMILDYVEHFRTSYNQKDLEFLEQVFSENALIITGKVIKVAKSDIHPSGRTIIYNKQSKSQYLKNLEKAFKVNNYIKVDFDDIVIVRHGTINGVYGVTVHQRWNSARYSDEGYVFMVWDFRNPDAPKVHVRTWQPEYIDKAKGLKLDPNDVFSLGSFEGYN